MVHSPRKHLTIAYKYVLKLRNTHRANVHFVAYVLFKGPGWLHQLKLCRCFEGPENPSQSHASQAALPEIYLCGGQSLRQTTPVLERYVHATGRQEDPPRGSMRRTTATPLAGLAVCQMFEVWRSGPVIWKTIGIQYWQGRKGFLTPSREMLRLCYTSWTPWNSGVLHAPQRQHVAQPCSQALLHFKPSSVGRHLQDPHLLTPYFVSLSIRPVTC